MKGRRSTHPEVPYRSSGEITRTLDRIAELVPKLIREGIEAYAYGFDRKDKRSIHADDQNQEKVQTFDTPDPTGAVALEQQHARRKVREAFNDIDKAEKLLMGAFGALGRVFKSPDYEPLRESLRAGDSTPRNVRRELEERERYLSKALSDVRQLLRKAG